MIWQTLGIVKTSDIRVIKRAYATCIKKCDPEKEPERFQMIHDAYREAAEYAQSVSLTGNEKELYFLEIADIRRYNYSCASENESVNDTADSSDYTEDDYDFSRVKSLNINKKHPDKQRSDDKEFIQMLEHIISDNDLRNSIYVWKTFFNRPDYCRKMLKPSLTETVNKLFSGEKIKITTADYILRFMPDGSRVFKSEDENYCYINDPVRKHIFSGFGTVTLDSIKRLVNMVLGYDFKEEKK